MDKSSLVPMSFLALARTSHQFGASHEYLTTSRIWLPRIDEKPCIPKASSMCLTWASYQYASFYHHGSSYDRILWSLVLHRLQHARARNQNGMASYAQGVVFL